MTIALRTQQIIAEESGVANVIDPLGGSYFVEWLTDRLEQRGARRTSSASTRWAAWSRAIEKGYPQREIAASRLPVPARRSNAASASWSA